MPSYICITHALGNQTEAERLADTLLAYGFACRRVHEATEPILRANLLFGAVCVLALISPEAATAEAIAEDIDRLLKKGREPICIRLGESPLDDRCCQGLDEREEGLACIPYPAGDHPDAHAVCLFIHRLFVCHLCRVPEAFSRLRCRRDDYGRAITLAIEAHGGDRDAAYALGCAYESGRGVPVLEDAAAEWITTAAYAGLADAILHLGELCLCGWGVEPDEVRARAMFTSVADSGDMRGEYRLGLCYLNGVGVVTDPTRAVLHLRRAARWGYPPALFRLALLYRDGIGVAPDAHLALQYLYEACRAGAVAEAACLHDEDVEAEATEDELASLADREAPTEEADNGTVPSSLHTLSDLTEITGENAVHASAPVYPLPPSLYGSRAAIPKVRKPLRSLRTRLLALSARSDAPTTRLPFARSKYAASHRPETAWIAGVTRLGHALSASGGQTQGHPALYMDRYDMAMGIPFDLAEVAVALGGLLESGGKRHGIYEMYPNTTRALVWYRYAFRRGNPEALYRLAEAYRCGHGTPPDAAWAVELYRMSADWGDARGQFALAVACERGLGTAPDMAEAIRHYERAAVAGHAGAQNNLGGCYEYGIGVSQNILTAVEWYSHAANAGLPEAMCRLALCCETGRGMPVDISRAFDLYRKASELGCMYACYRLGVFYERGLYTTLEGLSSADIASAGSGMSQDLSVVREETVDLSLTPHPSRLADAVRLWRDAAGAGVAEAAYAMAMCYSHGHGVRPDRERAMLYLRDAADGGCLQAVCRLALCTLEGNGVVPDPVCAEALLRQTVRMWHHGRAVYIGGTATLPLCARTPAESAADALYMLGYCTLEGVGAPYASDPVNARLTEAVSLFTEAASMGHVGAQIMLGDLYAYSRLIPTETSVELSSLSPAEQKRAAARIYYLRAIRLSSARRAEPCPLSEEDYDRAELHSEMLLPIVPLPDSRLGGLLASAADTVGVYSIPALMTLAREIMTQHADAHAPDADGSPAPDPEAKRAWERAWCYLVDAAEQGSAEARVGLAQCTYYGLGTEQNFPATLRHLQIAVNTPGCGYAAAMWLGDFYRTGWGGAACRTEDADDAYLRGLTAKPLGSEVGPYVLSERVAEQLAPESNLRNELLYRLATFRSIYLSDKAHDGTPVDTEWSGDRRETFSYFAEAILSGHAVAREDWARIYAYEHNYPTATSPADRPEEDAEGEKPARRKRALRRGKQPSPPRPAMRDHRTGLADYYTVLWLEPKPFESALRSVAFSSELPAHMTVSVTPDMTANALNYLGDCFYEGRGVARSYSSAVRCFREVASMGRSIPRNAPVPQAVVWSQYSLGWCLLKGQGCARNEDEAVSLLMQAARTHPDACYLLGQCYETGDGVDKLDLREAIKYYRRAVRFGNHPAVAKVREIEARLKEQADAEKHRHSDGGGRN